MIAFRNVSKSYRTAGGIKSVLCDFDCDLPTDQNIGILGRNGVGKSALMRMIAGSELPDRGRIMRDVRVSYPIGHQCGFSPMMTGFQNARFVARAYGEDPRRVTQFVDEFVELGSYLHAPLRTYSNGMRARLAFGICMAIPFDVYLVDEVTSVGDIEFKRKCVQVFGERRRTAKLIMVSNSSNTIRQYCDRGAIMESGTIVMYAHIEEAVAVYNDGATAGQSSHRER